MPLSTYDLVEKGIDTLLEKIEHETKISGEEVQSSARPDQNLYEGTSSSTSSVAENWKSRDQTALIHQLPPELLIEIFHLALSDQFINGHFYKLHKLACVSRGWNALIRQTPSLWAFVTNIFSPRLVTNALAKSKNAPLTLEFALSGHVVPVTKRLMEACEHVHRWGHVRLAVDGGRRFLTSLEVPAPLITHFDLRMSSPSPSIDLFKGQADRLQYLRLTRVSIPFRSTILQGLRDLTLKDVRPGPSVVDVLHVLAASPSMTTLILELFKGPADAPPEGQPPIVMSGLTELQILQLDPKYTSALLQNIHAPKCCSFALECYLNKLPAISFLNDTITPFLDPLTTIISHSTRFTFELTLNSITARSDSFRIGLFGVASPSRAFQWISETFRAPLMGVSTSIEANKRFDTSDPAFILGLENLSRVESFKGSDSILDYLGQPYLKDGVRHWNLPWLKELTIESAEDRSRLLPMVQSRYRTTAGVVPLEKLDVGQLSDRVLVEQLSAIVGEGVLKSTALS